MPGISYMNPGQMGPSAGGAKLADFLMQLSDRNNKIAMAGKAAEYMRKSFGDNAESESGITDDHWQNMGNADKAAWAQGYQDRQSMARLKAQAQLETAQAQKAQTDADADQFFSKVGANLSQQVNGTPTDPLLGRPMTNDSTTSALIANLSPQQKALIQAIGTAGPANRGAGPVMAQLAKSMLASTANEDNTPTMITLPDGTKVWGQRGTKNPWQVSPMTKTANAEDLIQAKADAVPDKTKLTEGQREKLILDHQKAKDQILTQLQFANGNAEAIAHINQAAADHQSAIDELKAPAGGAPAKGKTMTTEVARQYLQAAGGDKDKARTAAKKDGYSF